MIKSQRRKEHEKMNGWIEGIQNAIVYVEENHTTPRIFFESKMLKHTLSPQYRIHPNLL